MPVTISPADLPLLVVLLFGLVATMAICWKALSDLAIRPLATVSLWTWLYVGASLPKLSFRIRFAAPPEDGASGPALVLYELAGAAAVLAPVLAVAAVSSADAHKNPLAAVGYLAAQGPAPWLALGAIAVHGGMSLWYGSRMPDNYDHLKALRAAAIPEIVRKLFTGGK